MDETPEVSGDQNNEVPSSTDVPTLDDGHYKEQLKPLRSQVAGHSSSNGESSMGMLLHPEGYVMKPADKKPQGDNEIRFYEHLQTASDPLSQELREFVPCYYGTKSVLLGGKERLCIVLENVTHEMFEPCVMDIKIGKQTWEPTAPEEKKRVERAKYVDSKRECGFYIPGMQFYDISSRKFVKLGKGFGKKLDKDGVEDALRFFLNWKSSFTRPLIMQFLCKLWKILIWFQRQRKYSFYSSSLLFVYNHSQVRHYGSTLSDHVDSSSGPFYLPSSREPDTWKETELCCDEVMPNEFANVKMIDFAHTVISNESDIDSNYIEGLLNLVRIFEILLQESY